MLHKLYMPAYKAQLEAILDFQHELLSFACTAPSPSLTPALLKTRFGEQIGPWLSERCWKGGKGRTRNEFCKELENLIAHVGENPSEGPKIIDAFRNDRDFYNHLDDSNFEFQYPRLTQKAKDVLKPFMISFYEKILRKGFPDYIHLGTSEEFTYLKLLQEFYEANAMLQVCPACDGPRPRLNNAILRIKMEEEEMDKKRSNVQVDHFFPKALFPFFSIHFTNLVPLCRDCNIDKGDKNPLIQCSGKGALRHTFVPFLKPAVSYMEVTVTSNSDLRPKVILRDTQQTTFQCIKNLDTVFGLSTKWEDHLEGWIREEMLYIKIEFQEKLRKKRDRREVEKAIRKKLKLIANVHEKYIGQWHNLLAERGYANYALGNRLELDALIDQIMDENAPKNRW